MNITIPLGGGSNWGSDNELRYMLRSLETNLIGDYEIFIVGHKPDWIQNVTHFDTKITGYYSKIKYRNFYDTLHKLDYTSKILDEFIYAYDDQILLKPTKIEDCAKRKALHKIDKVTKSGNKWDNTIIEAYKICGDNFYNYETHIPRTFESNLLKEMFREWDWRRTPPYAPSSLYYNLFYDDHELLTEKDKVSFQLIGTGRNFVHDPVSMEFIEKVTDGVMWMNYCAKAIKAYPEHGGRTFILQDFIKNKFPNKSKYEKV